MIIYKVQTIPDLTLNKYQAFEDSGIDGMIKAQERLVRQLHRAMLLSAEISLHFIYIYKPANSLGRRLEIYILINDRDCNSEYTNKIKKLIKASGISEYYALKECDFDFRCEKYKHMTKMRKKERFLQTVLNNEEQYFYVVPNWELNEEARLFNMFKLMQTVNEPCCYRVDFYVKNGFEENIHKSFERPLSYLRNINIKDRGVSEFSRLHMEKRDPNADETLRQYETWLKNLDANPVFLCRICAFSQDQYLSPLLIDSAVSESLSSGDVILETNKEADEYYLDAEMDILPQYANESAPASLKYWPTSFLCDEATSFARLPILYDGESIEIPKETSVSLKDEGIYLGVDVNGHPTIIPYDLLAKHMFICGVPGSGKTNTMLHLADSLWNGEISINGKREKARIPFLALEPAKHEYRELANLNIPELIVFSPSANTKFPIQINPFEFPKNITLSEHIGKLCQVFEGAFPIEPPAPFILDKAIQKIYEKHGWSTRDINTGDDSKEYPTMSELYDQFEFELAETNYDSEIQGNIQSVLQMRIGSLLRREMKDIFDVKKSTFKPDEWINRPIVIELEALGEGPANFMTLFLCTLIREVLKSSAEQKDKKIKHVIFIEEAHNLIASESQMQNAQDSNPKIAATSFIVKMLAEVRALREGIIIADQLPSAMASEVIKNTNIKLVHRMTSQDDRELIGSTMSASPLQLEKMATFTQGQALIAYEKMLRPFEMQVSVVPAHDDNSSTDEKLYQTLLQKPAFRELHKNYADAKWADLINQLDSLVEYEEKIAKQVSIYPYDTNNRQLNREKIRQFHIIHEALCKRRDDCVAELFEIPEEFYSSERKEKLKDLITIIGDALYKNILLSTQICINNRWI